MDSIIFMEPVYKDYIWGGERIKKILNKDSPYNNTAESWEISANENGACKIKNREYKNKTLMELFENQKIKQEIFGKKCKSMNSFPLLIKYIDAKNDLSIQVHPDDKYAKQIGKTNGKNELWYIMDNKKNSQIIGGLNKNIDKKELEKIITNNEIKKYLNYINVKKGDSIYVEAGTIHAILKNNLICEIQQNSDITYRVYDWERVDKNGKPRQLHKEEAIKTIKINNIPIVKHTDNKKEVQNIVKNKYFTTDKIKCTTVFKDESSEESFYAINVVSGNGIIKTNKEEAEIKIGDSFLIPATLGGYEIFGNVEILKSYIS